MTQQEQATDASDGVAWVLGKRKKTLSDAGKMCMSAVIGDRKPKDEMGEKSNSCISRIMYFMGRMEFVLLICPPWTFRPVEIG